MNLTTILFFLTILLLSLLLHRLLTPPSHLPRSLPRIPIYVSLLSTFTSLDQTQIYARYLQQPLEAHGAVLFFFGARWNVLVQRPSYLSQIFRDRDEEWFAKSGNQEKIPYSVLAAFTGDNVISSSGRRGADGKKAGRWGVYRKVMEKGLQGRGVDIGRVRGNAERFVDLLLDGPEAGPRGEDEKGERKQSDSGPIMAMVNPIIQRFAIQCLGEEMLGTDFKTLASPSSKIHLIHTQLKRQIFKPLYLNFPFLDMLPIPSRVRAREHIKAFEEELVEQVKQGRGIGSSITEKSTSSPDDNVEMNMEKGVDSPTMNKTEDEHLLITSMMKARDEGVFTERQFRDNLKITFIAGHENVQQFLNSLLYILARYPTYQSRLRSEIASVTASSPSPSSPIYNNLPLLHATILETLRLYPPIPQLANRLTTSPTHLAPGILIPKGVYVAWTAYGANRDTTSWGVDAGEFRPERWWTLASSSSSPSPSPSAVAAAATTTTAPRETAKTDLANNLKNNITDAAPPPPPPPPPTVEAMQATMRKLTAKGLFTSFHGGSRACLGQAFALTEIKVAIVALLTRCQWRFADDSNENGNANGNANAHDNGNGNSTEEERQKEIGDKVKFTPGGLLAPVGLRLAFEEF